MHVMQLVILGLRGEVLRFRELLRVFGHNHPPAAAGDYLVPIKRIAPKMPNRPRVTAGEGLPLLLGRGEGRGEESLPALRFALSALRGSYPRAERLRPI